MKFDEIMQKITAGLTGQPEHDLKYLIEQGDIYKTHVLSQEITRAIGRLIYSVLPAEKRDDINRFVNNNNLGIEASLREADYNINQKNFSLALEILESVINKIEEDGELAIFRDDSVNEYHNFHNPFEQALFYVIYKPKKTIRDLPKFIDQLYGMHGGLLFELERFDEARLSLEKAIRINPINTQAIFELAEISKVREEWEKYFDLSKQAIRIAYTGESLSRCYRNIGYYFIEKKNYDVAIALYFFSMIFDRKSTKAQSELFYIQQITGNQVQAPSPEQIYKLLEKHGIQYGPNEKVLHLAAELGKQCADEEEYEHARHFYSIIYDLTHDNEVKELIDSLPRTN